MPVDPTQYKPYQDVPINSIPGLSDASQDIPGSSPTSFIGPTIPQPAQPEGFEVSLGGSNMPKITVPTNDFSSEDLDEVELARQMANSLEKKDRLNQAMADAQMPAIKKSIDEARSRADSFLQELRATREQMMGLNTPQLVQGEMNLGQLLANAFGAITGGRADVLNTQGMEGADKRNNISFQNDLSKFNITRENLGQLVDFLQKQYLSEESNVGDLERFGLQTQIQNAQTADTRTWQTSERVAGETANEKKSAWSQFYSANSDGEVLAAAQRLRELDPDHAPDSIAVNKAVASARTKRETAALDYYKQTVGRVIDAYQGVVPETVKKDLEERIRAIATNFEVDPKVFGEIPTEAFWKRAQEEKALEFKKNQWDGRLKWMTEKEKNDKSYQDAMVSVARERARIAWSNSQTSQARLEWQKADNGLKGLRTFFEKTVATKRFTLVGQDAKIAEIRSRYNGKDPSFYIPNQKKDYLNLQKYKDARAETHDQLEEALATLKGFMDEQADLQAEKMSMTGEVKQTESQSGSSTVKPKVDRTGNNALPKEKKALFDAAFKSLQKALRLGDKEGAARIRAEYKRLSNGGEL